LRYDPVVRAEFTGLPDNPTSYDIGPIARILIDDYLSGYADEASMVYTDYVNTIQQVPVVHKLLPVVPSEPSATMAPEYIFEPSPDAVLNRVLYGFTEVQILQALYESLASEHSARHGGDAQRHRCSRRVDRRPDPHVQQGATGRYHQRTDRYCRWDKCLGK
jgi:F-type H+-transporting ATPase subunit gamma